MQTRTRPYSLRCSSSWATALMASSSKRWSGRTKPCTPGMRTRSTNISTRPGSKISYKIELRKDKLTINRPFQVGIVVYQLAKLRMLQFYYEFLDYYLDWRDFELIQMDTDSMYFALAHDKFEDAIKPDYRVQFEADKKKSLAWDKWSNREPGLFKLEKQGTRAIALCSKCDYVEDEAGG